METGRKWCRNFVISFVMMMVTLGAVIVVVDPYFHYHKPLKCLAYKLYNERYQNDGIVKHFDYDAIITGTSMTQNFKTSEMDELFGTHAIKVPFAGAKYKEIKENIERAITANPNIKIIVWGLDFNRVNGDVNAVRYDSYPTYLYDNVLLNDINYIFNKTVLFEGVMENVISYSRKRKAIAMLVHFQATQRSAICFALGTSRIMSIATTKYDDIYMCGNTIFFGNMGTK